MEDSYPSLNSPPKEKKIIYIALFLTVIVMFLAAITFIISHTSANKTPSSTTQPPTGGQTETQPTTIASPPNPPQVQFVSYIDPQTTPVPQKFGTVYTFKQSYTKQEADAFAQKLDTPTAIQDNNKTIYTYYSQTDNGVAALDFNVQTGSFSYVNSKGVLLSNTIPQPEDRIYNYLKTIERYDPTLKVTAHYQKKDYPGIVFYELHRDWKETGLPIVNFNGLFNIIDNQSIKALDFNSSTLQPLDSQIFATSDNKDGIKRADDFNTMTVAVSDDNNFILKIDSNIRQVVPNMQKSVPLLSYEDALAKLKANQYDRIFTSPSGAGNVSWIKIYPNNRAISDQAVINEAAYVYLEDTPYQAQKTLRPYIIFSGTSTLKSGYSVNFIASVDLTTGNTIAMRNQVLGTSTYIAQNITTTTPGGTQGGVIKVTPITPAPTGTKGVCEPALDQLTPTFTFQDLTLGLGPYVHFDSKGREVRNEQRWYYIPPLGFNEASKALREETLVKAFNTFTTNIATLDLTAMPLSNNTASLYCEDKNNHGHTDKSCKREIKQLLDDFEASEHYFNQTCPLIFSGLSPVLFIYGPAGTSLTIKPWASLTYADPAPTEDMWYVTVGSNQKLSVNNSLKDFIYYEYAPVTFNRPQQGWNINKKNISKFIDMMSSKLQLKSLEKIRMNYEIQNVLGDVNSDSVFIGLIDQTELNVKIPLSLNPSPQSVTRLHFYIGKVNNQKISAPQIQPIERRDFMVLELGAVPGK